MPFEFREHDVQSATAAAILVSLEHLGAETAPENVVRQLRRFGLEVSVADVEAVKATYSLARPATDGRVPVEPVVEAPPDDTWREAEATAAPTLIEAKRLLVTAGSVELAKHSLEVVEGATPHETRCSDESPRT